MYGAGPGIGAGIGGTIGGGGALMMTDPGQVGLVGLVTSGPGQVEVFGLLALVFLIPGALLLRSASVKHRRR